MVIPFKQCSQDGYSLQQIRESQDPCLLKHFNLILMKMIAEIHYLSSEMFECIILLYNLKIKSEDIYDGNKTLFPA